MGGGGCCHSNECKSHWLLWPVVTKETLIMLPTSSELINQNHYQLKAHLVIILETYESKSGTKGSYPSKCYLLLKHKLLFKRRRLDSVKLWRLNSQKVNIRLTYDTYRISPSARYQQIQSCKGTGVIKFNPLYNRQIQKKKVKSGVKEPVLWILILQRPILSRDHRYLNFNQHLPSLWLQVRTQKFAP